SRLRELDDKEREVIDSEFVMTNLIEIIGQLSSLKSNNQDAISYLKDNKPEIFEKEVSVALHNKETVMEQKDKDSLLPKKKNYDLKKIAKIVLQFLKEFGMPVKSREIFNYLEQQYNYKWNRK